MKPRIMLTGRQGQVGWELERVLPELGEVFAFGRDELDLANPDQVREKVRLLKPDIVVNAAAYTEVDKAEEEPELAMTINGIAPGILAEEARGIGALLVHYSTDYVFDGTKEKPYTEEDEPCPLNVYGKTKLAGERAIQATWDKHLIFRTSWVYGLRGRNFLLTILKLAKEREEIRVVDDQVGAPTWSKRIAMVTIEILKKTFCAGNKPESTLGLFNITNKGSCSWYGFAREILASSGDILLQKKSLVPIPSEEFPTRATRPRNSRLDCSKAEESFGIQLPHWRDDLALLAPFRGLETHPKAKEQ
jgi:dTDP-4-dehydrorhamnose reductase